MSFSSEVSKVNAESCIPVESSSKAITTLPNEILFKIYDDLGIGDLKELSVTCKSLNSAQIVRGAKGYDILELKRFIQDLIPKLKNVMAMDKFINKFFEDENLYRQINANNFPTRNFAFRLGFEALYEKSIRKLESMNAEIDLENTAKSDLTNLQDSLVRILAPFQLGSEYTLYSDMNGLDCRKKLYNSIKTYLQDQIQNSQLDAEKIQSLHEICSLDFQTNPLEFKDLSFYKSIFSASRMLYNVIIRGPSAISYFNRACIVSRSHQSSQEKNQLSRLGFFPESHFCLIDPVNTPIDIEDAIEAYKNIQNPQVKTKAKFIVAFYYIANDQKAKAKEFLESEVDPANVNKFINLTLSFEYDDGANVHYFLNRLIDGEGNLLQNGIDIHIFSLIKNEIQRPDKNLDFIISIIDEISNPNIKNQALYALVEPILKKEKINERDLQIIDKIIVQFCTDIGIPDYRQIVELRRDLVLGKYDYTNQDDQIIVTARAEEIEKSCSSRDLSLCSILADKLLSKNFLEGSYILKTSKSPFAEHSFIFSISEKAVELDKLEFFYEKLAPDINNLVVRYDHDRNRKTKLVEKLLDKYIEKVGIENIQYERFLELIKTFEYLNLNSRILNHFKDLGTKLLGENKIKESLELLSIIQKNSKNFIFKEIICELSPTFRSYPDILRSEFYFSNIVKHILSQSKDKERLLPEILLKIFENLNNEQEAKINILHKIFDQHFDELSNYLFLRCNEYLIKNESRLEFEKETLTKEFKSVNKIDKLLRRITNIHSPVSRDEDNKLRLESKNEDDFIFRKKEAEKEKTNSVKVEVLKYLFDNLGTYEYSISTFLSVISELRFSNGSSYNISKLISALTNTEKFSDLIRACHNSGQSFLENNFKCLDPIIQNLVIKGIQSSNPILMQKDIELMKDSSLRKDVTMKIFKEANFKRELKKIYTSLPASFDRLIVVRNNLLQTSTSNRLITEFKFLAYAIFEIGAILTNFFKNLFKFKKK